MEVAIVNSKMCFVVDYPLNYKTRAKIIDIGVDTASDKYLGLDTIKSRYKGIQQI